MLGLIFEIKLRQNLSVDWEDLGRHFDQIWIIDVNKVISSCEKYYHGEKEMFSLLS